MSRCGYFGYKFKKTMLLMVVGISFVFGVTLNGCSIRGLKRDVEMLGYESERRECEAILKIHQMGKQAIPELIAEISTLQKAKVPYDLRNPWDSHFEIDNEFESYGFLYAYIVELILGKEKIEAIDWQGMSRFLGMPQNFVYWAGMIKDETGKRARGKNLIEIQRIYKDWWLRNKYKSLKQLRAEWQKGIRPLSGSKFKWE